MISTTLSEMLDDIQWKQFQHDEKYHREITFLPTQRRMIHLSLHLAKYSAKLLSNQPAGNSHTLKSILVDSLIIIVSAANTLNIRLSDALPDSALIECMSIDELGKTFATMCTNHSDEGFLKQLIAEFSSQTGIICKITESLDHLEHFNFKTALVDCLGEMFRLCLIMLHMTADESLGDLFSQRLVTVEQKSIFFKRLGNYAEGYEVPCEQGTYKGV